MKQSIILFFALTIGITVTAQVQQQPKKFKIELTEPELMAVLNLINEAKLSGEERRAFDKLFRDQALAQLPKPTDSTSKKQPQPKQPAEKPKQ